MPSGRISRMRASATRIFQLPESRPASLAVHAFLAEAQARQHLARPGFQRIAIEPLEAPLHLAVARDDGVHVGGARGIDHGRIDHGGLELGHLGGQECIRRVAGVLGRALRRQERRCVCHSM